MREKKFRITKFWSFTFKCSLIIVSWKGKSIDRDIDVDMQTHIYNCFGDFGPPQFGFSWNRKLILSVGSFTNYPGFCYWPFSCSDSFGDRVPLTC